MSLDHPWSSPLMMHLLLASALLLSAPQTPADTTAISSVLPHVLAAPGHAEMKWGNLGDVRSTLSAGYASRSWEPLWLDAMGATSEALRVITQLQHAGDYGLEPDDYDAGTLAREAAAIGSASVAARATFDLTLSAAAIRYSIALYRGRVDPRQWHPHLRMPASVMDTVATLLALSRSSNPDSIWRALQPAHTGYWQLISLLQQMRKVNPSLVTLTSRDLPARLDPLEEFGAAPTLRALLVALGELPQAAPPEGDTLYSSDLVEAVKRFQKHQALAPDGVIGAATMLRLTLPWEARLRQVALTLERWRWLPIPIGTPVVSVNIPAMQVRAVDPRRANGDTLLEMKVVIGKVVGFQTPLLSTIVSGVQVRPPWIVPTSIARDEIRPRALKDSTIMSRERFVLLRGDSILPPTMANIKRIAAGVELRQLPGPLSALSQLKLAMSNPANIYLHDSPERTLFGKPERAFSHGCIRMADAKALAGFLLTGNTNRPDSSWYRALRADSTVLLPLGKTIPVLVVYHTVAADAAGTPTFFSDIYNVDPALDGALRRGYPYPLTSGPARRAN